MTHARGTVAALALAAIALQALPISGQDRPAPAAGTQTPAEAVRRVSLGAGRSTVLSTRFDITRIAVTDPAIADATLVQPREVLIDARTVGTVSVIMWGGTNREQFEVVVTPGVGTLQRQLETLFPGEDIRVTVSDEAIVLSGLVSSADLATDAAAIAQASSAKSKVVNLLRYPVADTSQQVLLQVRFAEVNRRAIEELGVNFLARRSSFDARSTTQQFTAPIIDDERQAPVVFSDFLNLFFFYKPEGIATVIRALKSRGYFHSLAEPNLIAYNGQDASFLAGGEFPVPVVQGNNNAVTVQYREFGVRLHFKPTIVGDQIRLKVEPEVSTIDFNNGVTLSGFRIPALSSRKASTDVELRDGQSFAIAGLLNNTSQLTTDRIPLLSSIPIIGPLFKSKASQKDQTELLVMITPRLVRPLDGAAWPVPTPILPVDPNLFLQPADPREGRTGVPGKPGDPPAPAKKPGKGGK